MQPRESGISIFAVIVLYRMEAAASPTLRTLLDSIASSPGTKCRVQILLHDNTPATQASPPILPGNVQYFASPSNVGLSDAYNRAANAAGDNYDWLLTLDQDTEIPLDFIAKLCEAAHACQAKEYVAAIVPHITSGARDVSPHRWAAGLLPAWYPKGYVGIPAQAVYAFNSGSLIRLSSLSTVGGYSPLFWLDFSDMHLFRQFEKRGLKVYVAGDIELLHDFSLLDYTQKMSLFRYRNAAESVSAFYDIERGWLSGAEHTLRLGARLVKQILTHKSPEYRSVTQNVLHRRLFTGKRNRIAAWIAEQEKRIGAQKQS